MQLKLDNDDNDDIEMIDLVSMDNIEMIFFFAIHELYIDIYILLTTYIIFFL